uniref:WW domain containing transcription regulator 1 n=1 Tax=Malurus cyaneus samueli TaxID=2593467 RepID=A0A8C5T5M7_9PASS
PRPGSAPSPALPRPSGTQVIHVTQDLDTELRRSSTPSSGSRLRARTRGSPARLGRAPPRPAPPSRSHSSPASLPGAGAAPQHGHLRQRSCDVTDERPLPPGWEMALTQTGQRYFLNHIEKITTWQDPRKPMSQQMNHVSRHPAATSAPMPQRSMAMSQPNLMLNAHSQLSPAVLQQSRPPQPPALLTLPGALSTQQQQQQQQQQQKLRLQRIQMERERIRMRQEELLRQEAALCRQLPMDSESMVPVQTAVSSPAMSQDMRAVTNNGSDPFLNSGPYHSREQSTDSGLGLGCYSIPTTPEDFLSNVDEMDTGETIAQTSMNINPQQTRFPDFLDCLPGTNVDLGTLESEDLIPIFNDVESVLNKNEPFLTWL